MANPRTLVSPPTFTPLPYGLLSVVEYPAAADTHWTGGINWQSKCISSFDAATWDECISVTGVGQVAAPPPKTANVDLVTRGATPFTTVAEFDCALPGGGLEQAQQMATDALNQVGSWQVERAFWTGQVQGTEVVFPHLADNTELLDGTVLLQSAAVTGGSATTDIAEGLGFLEDQLANCYNGVGLIHVPAVALPTLDAWGLVKANGGVLRTLAGNKVVVGSGYPGTSPAGAAPAAGTTWMYATGAVFAYAGGVRVNPRNESIDRAENTIKLIAERTYVLGWDCCHAGVLVQLGVPAT